MNRLFVLRYEQFTLQLRKFHEICIYKEEFIVNPFSTFFVTCPFNVKINPIDVHKYASSDKLIISLFSNKPNTKVDLSCMQDNMKFNILGNSIEKEPINCYIETPVKSNINVLAKETGDIHIKKFNGDELTLHSDSGKIITESCQSSKVNVSTVRGSITTLGTLHAAEIQLEAKHNANINVNHLQALKATVLSTNGDIKIKSSYCDDTVIKTNAGKLYLENMHKNCSITILEDGYLQMSGFDGILNVNIMKGDVDIQISKLYERSKIEIKQKSFFLLRLSEWIQDNTRIEAYCQQLKVSSDIKLIVKNKDNYCSVLTPKHSNYTSNLDINANFSNIDIEGASWSDMIKLKLLNSSD